MKRGCPLIRVAEGAASKRTRQTGWRRADRRRESAKGTRQGRDIRRRKGGGGIVEQTSQRAGRTRPPWWFHAKRGRQALRDASVRDRLGVPAFDHPPSAEEADTSTVDK